MTALTKVPKTELWTSFPEATRNYVLGLLSMLLERLAVSPMPARRGPGVSTVLPHEHDGGKIQGWHRDRLAVAYVRQSSRRQVLDHGESTRLQNGLADRAVALGCSASRVMVIDEDLGRSSCSPPDQMISKPRGATGQQLPGLVAEPIQRTPRCFPAGQQLLQPMPGLAPVVPTRIHLG